MKVRGVLRFHGGLTNTGDFKREVNWRLEKLDRAEWADKKVEALSKVPVWRRHVVGPAGDVIRSGWSSFKNAASGALDRVEPYGRVG